MVMLRGSPPKAAMFSTTIATQPLDPAIHNCRRRCGQIPWLTQMRKKTKNTQPIVRLNDDDAFLGKILPVVTRFAIGASDKSTA